jgi:hypothetical protein
MLLQTGKIQNEWRLTRMNLRKKDEKSDYLLDVTDYVKPIMGNCLVKAEVEIPSYNSLKEAQEIAKDFMHNCLYKTTFHCDATDVHLYIRNGKKINEVVFENSEWGSICKSGETKDEDEDKDKLCSMSAIQLRDTYLDLKLNVEDGVEISNDILTMAYLAYPDDCQNATSLFLKDVEKEIIDRFLYLQD